MTIPEYEVDEREEEWIKWIEVNKIFMGEISLQNLEGKAIVLFSIYSQPVKDGGGYDLIEINQANGKGKDKDSDEYNLGLKPFLPKTISIHTVTLYCVRLIVSLIR